MITYTRELLNSNCDLDFINSIVQRAHGTHKIIANKVLDKIKENRRIINEAKKHNAIILNNPRLSRFLGNPRLNMPPVTLKEEPEVTKKFVYDITTERDFRDTFKNMRLYECFDYELSWKFALEMIVTELKKVFIDSNIYYENKEVKDVYDNVAVHRLIIIEWGSIN